MLLTLSMKYWAYFSSVDFLSDDSKTLSDDESVRTPSDSDVDENQLLDSQNGDSCGSSFNIATLHAIRRFLTETIAEQASLTHDEQLHFPTRGENADCIEMNTLSVDAFLFDDDVVEDMKDSGQLPTHYCANCGSRSVLPLSKFT